MSQHAEDSVLVRSDAVSSEEYFTTFRKIVLPLALRSSRSFACILELLDLENKVIRIFRNVGIYSPEDTAHVT